MEWIDRSKQREPKNTKVLYYWSNTSWMEIGSDSACATHWMPLPDPPPRTVTIEISEEVARRYACLSERQREVHVGDYEFIAGACRKALEEKK